jgi:hypothetical protein
VVQLAEDQKNGGGQDEYRSLTAAVATGLAAGTANAVAHQVIGKVTGNDKPQEPKK